MQTSKRPFFMLSAGALALMLAAGAQAAPNVYGSKTGYTDHRASELYNGLPVESKKHDAFQLFAYAVTATNPGSAFENAADNGYWAGVALPIYSGGQGREKVHMEFGYMMISKSGASGSPTVTPASWEAGWQAGHDSGFETGYDSGYMNGHGDGYADGYSDGWAAGDAGDPNDPSGYDPIGVTDPDAPTAPAVTAPTAPSGTTAPGAIQDVERKALTAAVAYSYELYTNTQFKTRLRGQVGAARISGVTDEVSLFYGAGIELAQGRYALRIGYDKYSKSENIDALAYMGVGINF
ncbi:MAG: hypothetical protein IBX50_08180 [Marinospirillum sp.]|uniref:hypothetical protein n=1 Tax=Marinospirillum sp. TaxID=2183934 RepID=UPI001A01D946|nr:hypothetical protein [Marinospirillum sp.]MBE0506683.1 hypothetical protein [Marinospirillum sp.]